MRRTCSRFVRPVLRRLLVFAFLFLSFTATAQQYLFDHFTTADGLPSNMAYRCTRDAEGFIWIATSGGVARFDGQSFETFSEADGLPDNDIVFLLVDERNRVWFFGFNGKAAFYAGGTIHTAATDKWLQPLQAEAFVLYAVTDKQHNLFLVYNNSLIKCITVNNTALTCPFRGNLFFIHDKLWRLPGTFDCSTDKSLHSIYGNDSIAIPPYLRGHKMQRTAFEPSLWGNLFYSVPQDIYLLANDDLSLQWLCHSPVILSRIKYMSDSIIALLTPGGGIYFFDIVQRKFTRHLLLNETITDAFINENGDLWCTSLNNGVFYLSASRGRARYITATEQLYNEKCTAIFTRTNGDTWVGVDNASVQVFEHNRLNHSISFDNDSRKFGRINNIVALPGDRMCISGDIGLYLTDRDGNNARRVRFYEPEIKNSIPMNVVKSCSVTGTGDILVSIAGNLERLSAKDLSAAVPVTNNIISLPDRVLCAFEDSRRNIWIGTSRGLMMINGKDTLLLYRQNALLGKRILQAGETRSGYLVLVTDGAGIIVLKDRKVCAHFTAENGLAGNSCRRMFIIGDTVYVATSAGVAIAGYDKKQGIFTYAVTEKDGLLSADCRDVAVTGGELYAATDRGVSILALKHVLSVRTVPHAYLKKIVADGKVRSLTDGTLHLKYGVKSVVVSYGAVSQHASSGIEYRYRTSSTGDWVVTRAPSFVYNDPQPQQMEVAIQARYKGGAWGSSKTILIVITPRFYQRAWFIIVLILLLLAIAAAGLIFYYRKQRQKLYNQNRLIKLESQASQAMMNPHFVFNALNSVQHFLNENDNYAANQYLTRFSRLIRRHLELNRGQYISLEEEFDFLRLYLEVEKSRCEDKLIFRMQVQKGIEPDEIYVPVLILQPLVENAIWHGISPKTSGGSIEITACINHLAQLEIKIMDDGVGFPPEVLPGGDHQSMGLGIIRDRLQLLAKLYDREFSIHYSDATAGTVVIVRFPVLKEEDLLPLL